MQLSQHLRSVRALAGPCRSARASKYATVTKASTGEVLLEVKDLTATIVSTGTAVLKGVTLTIKQGETHVVMGKNGSGKSTFSKVLVGHPDYEVTGGTVLYKGENLLDMEPEERSRAGVFLSFQSPIEVPGVNNVDFLRMAANARRKSQGKPEFEPLDFYMELQPKVRGRSFARPNTHSSTYLFSSWHRQSR